jgi:peptidoglycan/xylan/chitin deacetylase (PgdA/CDA1 family)
VSQGLDARRHDGALTDKDVVPMVEQEVARHPEFSAEGTKGVLGLTGYEGLFGEHHAKTPAARNRLRALVRWLVDNAWTIASHTWGHINLTTNSLSSIEWDTRQWKSLADPVIGHTDVLIYPFGARPSDAAVRFLVRAGFRIQLDIDEVARTVHRDGAIIMSRRHVDGYAFEVPARQRKFDNVATVRDPRRPG